MTLTEQQQIEARLAALFQHHIEEFRKDFVSKTEFTPVKTMVEKHDKVYNKVQNLLIYIGILATFQLIFGNSWQRALEFAKFVFGK
jgi:hypothetical protein